MGLTSGVLVGKHIALHALMEEHWMIPKTCQKLENRQKPKREVREKRRKYRRRL